MKKLYISVMLTLTILSLFSCGVDFYSGKRPIDYPDARWLSENPNIYFDVIQDNFSMYKTPILYGKIIINGNISEIIIGFDHGVVITFRDISAYTYEYSPNGDVLSDEWLFKGTCKFSKDKLVVKITKNRGFLDESIKTITFIRTDLPEN